MAVTKPVRIRRESNSSGQETEKGKLFSEVLNSAVKAASEKTAESDSKTEMHFQNLVYGKDMMLRPMALQKREYHY